MSKVKQGIISLIMLVFVLFSAFSLVACGEEGGGNEDDTPAINAIKWTGTVEAMPTAVENVIEIENGEQLAGFAKAVNDNHTQQRYLEGYTVKLMADINLDNIEWTPIGKDSSHYLHYVFAGTFDGNGHTLYNLKVTANADQYEGRAGLFGALLGSVENLNIKYATITSTWFAGTIVAYVPDGKTKDIKNCHVENVTVTSTAEIINDEYDNGNNVGGIVGYTAASNIEGCSIKNAVITGYRDIGGIVGKADSKNYSPVSVVNNTIGENVTIRVDNTHNYKNFTENENYNVGSVVGRPMENPTVQGNVGTATIIYPY